MSGFGGAPGYESYGSAQQQDRSRINTSYDVVAPKPSAPPSRLSRVLYIPCHNNLHTHLPIHNISDSYKFAIGHAPMGGSDVIGDAVMGSRLYMVRLGTIQKPSADKGDKAEYGIAFESEGNHATAIVRKFHEGQERATEVKISIPKESGDFHVITNEPVDVVASFPTTEHHPFFTFTSAGAGRTLQWQVHPSKDGPLRYTLVELETTESLDDSHVSRPGKIQAVFHYLGQDSSMSLERSEGVLLVPEYDESDGAASMLEMEVLSSLIGLLWRLREVQAKHSATDVPQAGKPSFLKRIFRKD